MKLNRDATAQKKFFLFRLSRPIRIAIYLPLIAAILFFGLRQLEFLVTYHPRPYAPGPRWTPPANGEEVWFPSAKGERVHGWLLRAKQTPAFATVLYCHGNGGDLTDVGWVAEAFAHRGLDVLIFDYRGYGRSEGRLSDEWGLYTDADAAYDHLTRARGVRPDQLVLHGQSLGTTAAIDVASRRMCAALVVESGLSSASEMGAAAFPWLPRWLHVLSRNRFESARKIASVKAPVLITHGTKDEIVPVEQGRRLFDAARQPKQLMIVEGGDHNLAGTGGNRHLDSIATFIRKALATNE
jgi:fermentation-respiration switch protein FrsA (DUF1100 family)